MRVAGSKGPADVVALRAGDKPLLVQVKAHRRGAKWSAFPPKERAALSALASRTGADAIYCFWPPNQKMQWLPETEWPSKHDYLVDEESGCWVWQKAKDSWGYGALRAPGGKQVGAHRYYYEMHVGPIPQGYFIDHLCRNRGCVNPLHLEAVTPAENARRRRGLKLTAADAAEIRKSRRPILELAETYGVRTEHVYAIKRGECWSPTQLPGEEKDGARDRT